MGFSRQEYWSGVPLPSPEDNIRKCTKVHRDVADSSPGSRFESYLRSGRTTLVTQTVKNLPAMQEIQVRALDPEDPLEKGMQPTPVFFPGESHGQWSLVGYSPWGRNKSDTT